MANLQCLYVIDTSLSIADLDLETYKKLEKVKCLWIFYYFIFNKCILFQLEHLGLTVKPMVRVYLKKIPDVKKLYLHIPVLNVCLLKLIPEFVKSNLTELKVITLINMYFSL